MFLLQRLKLIIKTHMDTIFELLKFFIKNKKFFLIPIIVFLLIFGGLLIISSGSTLAPFIYAIF